MKHLHITNTDKFVEPYINFINKNFFSKEHDFFCFRTNSTDYIKKHYNNLFKFDKVLGNLKFLKGLYHADRVYLHGLFDIRICLTLFCQPWLLKKCYWAIWGGDLYIHQSSRLTLKEKIKECIRRFVIKRVGGLITHIKGDYELAKNWYGATGEYHYSFLYPSNLYNNISTIVKPKDKLVIQIGNSADKSNNHIEIIDTLGNLKLEKIHIICPLSYGDNLYAKKVVKRGKEIFGDKFEPLLDFIPFDEYKKILSIVDVAIFNHDRQQAVGNITTLLGLGKKVYIREEITTWSFCKEHNLKVYSVTKDINNLLTSIDSLNRKNNIENVQKQFSTSKLVGDWKKIFN